MTDQRKIVFLGTPQVAADALKKLLDSVNGWCIIAVVTQPPARAARGSGVTQSPVHLLALEHQIQVLAPETARDVNFIETIKQLAPDLCITAAYGNVLPQEFLDVPKFGTLNIHPSLLPKYRGAAPVQRSVEQGDPKTGVTILYTVAKMDAGPILFQQECPVEENIKAPALLNSLFNLGAELLIAGLPQVFNKTVVPREQNEAEATRAKKIIVEEGLLDFKLPARQLHNKVRAFAGWPGTRSVFEYDGQVVEIKIVTTSVSNGESMVPLGVRFEKGRLRICCGDMQVLEIIELQAPGKRVMSASDFWNGLKIKTILWRA